jgi:hypothetical protein
MGYIPSADTIYAVAYLTETGRNYLFNETNGRFDASGDDLFEITKFTLSDADTNYQTTLILSSGEVPDVTGKSEGCLKTTANYVQTNLLAFVFDDTPTNVSYATSLDGEPGQLIINEKDVPPSNEFVQFPLGGGKVPLGGQFSGSNP